jgi:hypothetical protein
MAGLRFTLQTAEVNTGTSKKTALQLLAGANTRVKVKEISISFKGTTNTASPIIVEVLRQTGAGSGGDVLTPTKIDADAGETLQTTALKDIDGSTQPTDVAELLGEEVHPQGGYTWQAPFDGELIVNGGDRLGIAVTAAATVACKVRMICEE